MTQPFPRFCPQCGSPRVAGQRFCPTCGASLDMAANDPTARASDQQPTLASPSAPDVPPLAPVVLAAHGSAAGAPNTGSIFPQAPLPGSRPTPALDTSAPTHSTGSGGQLSMPPPPPPASLFAEPAPVSPVLPFDMVDKSTSPLQTHFGPVFRDEAVQRDLLFPEPGSIQVLLRTPSPISL